MYEKDVSPEKLGKYPQLYQQVQKGMFWNLRLHVEMLLSSIWHSLLIFGAIYFVNYNGASDNQGHNTGYWIQTYLFSTPLLLTVLVKHSLMTYHWIWITWASILLSILLNLVVMFAIQGFIPLILYYDYKTAIIQHFIPTYYLLCILIPVLCALPDLFSM